MPRFWFLVPLPATISTKNQASDHYFRIYDPEARIRLKLTLKSFEFPLLISTTHFSGKTHGQLTTTCCRLPILYHHTSNLLPQSHPQNSLGSLTFPLIQPLIVSFCRNFPFCPREGSLYGQHTTYSSMHVDFTFWTDRQPERSAPQQPSYVEAAPLISMSLCLGDGCRGSSSSTWASKWVHTEYATPRGPFNLGKSVL